MRRGFTLIELMVVIAILGVLGAAITPAVNAVTGANARQAAGELAGAARYLFDTAAMRHQTCRLVLDLDEAKYWAECTKDRFFVPAGRDDPSARPARGAGGAESKEPDDAELAERFPDEPDAEKRRLLGRATFAQFSDRLARERSLPGDARFRDVWSEHLREPVSRGLAYVYFHPSGQAEAARIPIVDGDNVYTVVTQPFTGRARVVTGVPQVPRS